MNFILFMASRTLEVSILPENHRFFRSLNYSSRKDLVGDTSNILDYIRTSLIKLPPNATDLVEPVDSSVIQEIWEACKRQRDEYNIRCMGDKFLACGIGKIPSSNNRFYL